MNWERTYCDSLIIKFDNESHYNVEQKSIVFFKMRVAVQGLRMERNRRLLWDMTKIIFNSIMTILIFGLLIGMVKQ